MGSSLRICEAPKGAHTNAQCCLDMAVPMLCFSHSVSADKDQAAGRELHSNTSQFVKSQSCTLTESWKLRILHVQKSATMSYNKVNSKK